MAIKIRRRQTSCPKCHKTKNGSKCRFRSQLDCTNSTTDEIKSTLEREAKLGCHAKKRILATFLGLWKVFKRIP